MAHTRVGLLAQIEAGVVDESVSLSSLLQKCIVLGSQARSEEMRAWARRELNGYSGTDEVPEYRQIPAVLTARITNMAGYNGGTTRIDRSAFSQPVLDMMAEKQIDVDNAVFGEGIGVLEAMANEEKDEHCFVPYWAGFVADTLNRFNMSPGSRVADVYWSVSSAAIRGMLVRVRTALAELVAELNTLMPDEQEVPDKRIADQAVQFVTGDGSVINYTVQHASDGGTNVTVNSRDEAGPVTGAGAHASAVGSQEASGANSSVAGSQEASGANSSVVGGQSVQADRDLVIAGQDAAVHDAAEQPARDSWWARLRKRGAVVAFATIIGAIATVAAVGVAIAVAAGWKP
jgi:hypothetical protein